MGISLFLPACKKSARCDLLQYDYSFPEGSRQAYAYAKIYAHESDFSLGLNGHGFASGNSIGIYLSEHDIPMIDLRREDGLNNWAKLAASQASFQPALNYQDCLSEMRLGQENALDSLLSSSPTYLHLVLPDLYSDGGDKTWYIANLYDLNGNEVTNDLGWRCLKNILFTFYKGGKGAKVKLSMQSVFSCQGFEELFDDRLEAFATYSLEGPLQDELHITYPVISDEMRLQLTFKVTFSSYDQLDIAVLNGSNELANAILYVQ